MWGRLSLVTFFGEAKKVTRPKEALNKSFDKLRTNGNLLIPFVVSLSNHERNQLVQRFPKAKRGAIARQATLARRP